MKVYWGGLSSIPFYLDVLQPEPLVRDFKKLYDSVNDKDTESNFLRCPATQEFVKNTFVLKSPIDISFICKEDGFFTLDYDQSFFDNFVIVRDIKSGFVSLSIIPYIFFTDQDCTITYTGPYFASNEFNNSCKVMPGSFNISKWFRYMDLAFFIRNKNEKITIKKGDTLAYIKFNTNDRIELKKFYLSERLEDILIKFIDQKRFLKDKSIKNYFNNIYSIFHQSKIKNTILKEIKNNLME